MREWPDLEVWVHERGAPHLADPSRLVASARRLYGEDFERLWGEVVPIPPSNLRVLRGGESIEGWDVLYTPGHASHHVSYRHGASGWAFVGDTAGMRMPSCPLVLPPTPPPDIDLEAWRASLDAIAEWDPAALAITHFGCYDDPAAHFARIRRALDRWGALARLLDREGYAAALRAALESSLDEDTVASWLQAMPPGDQWLGLDRYFSRVSSAR